MPMRSAPKDKYVRLRRFLIEQRVKAGLSQAGLAARLGRLQSYVSKYERGERRLDVIELLEVCAALGVDWQSCINHVESSRP